MLLLNARDMVQCYLRLVDTLGILRVRVERCFCADNVLHTYTDTLIAPTSRCAV